MAKTTKKEPLDKKNNSKAKESTPWVNETAQDRAGQSLILFSVALLVALSPFTFTDKKIKVPFLN
jgi:S-DNA-T family DNA segregation ATPase FtsK/SpoIIIE